MKRTTQSLVNTGLFFNPSFHPMNFLKAISTFAVAVLLAACSAKPISKSVVATELISAAQPDYSNLQYWAAHPQKWDPSDSVPQPLKKFYVDDPTVDVFFVHPTTLTQRSDTNSNASLDDEAINQKTDNSSILYQASAFNGQAKVYAPRYRQAHYQNYFTADTVRSRHAFELAYQDVKKAFETYLSLYNQGRPIIIAAHSQGTTHAARLMKELVEGTRLQHKLVCAYLVGMPIPINYFTTIPPCRDSLQTGCFVSWRTYERGFEGNDYVRKETFKAVVTNPLTWSSDTLAAPASLNTGGVLKKFNKVVKGVTDAQVHGNILWSSKPRFFGNFLLRQKNYHVGDINLFYTNIRQNMATRKRMFWKN
ncbi:MAG: DUF3089 domain-containing protein [Chitinophagaceae bacterium]|nr:MAG: DUF3089 domain-containing protein [Chitinophagaceae bacterium]